MPTYNPVYKNNIEAAQRTAARTEKKANAALADWRGPLGHPQDLIDFERFAIAQQHAARRLHHIEVVASWPKPKERL